MPHQRVNAPAGTESTQHWRRQPLIFQDAASAPISLCSLARRDRSITLRRPASPWGQLSFLAQGGDGGGAGHPRAGGSPEALGPALLPVEQEPQALPSPRRPLQAAASHVSTDHGRARQPLPRPLRSC